MKLCTDQCNTGLIKQADCSLMWRQNAAKDMWDVNKEDSLVEFRPSA